MTEERLPGRIRVEEEGELSREERVDRFLGGCLRAAGALGDLPDASKRHQGPGAYHPGAGMICPGEKVC